MRPIHVSAILLALAVSSVGCAAADDEDPSPSRDWSTEKDDKKKPSGTDTSPGTSTDTTVPTPAQDPAMTPQPTPNPTTNPTPIVCKDAKEANNTKDSAADLGAMTDNPASSRVVADLSLSDGDEDWFKFKVTDAGFGGNPQIDVSVTLATAEVSIFFVCDSQPDYSTCTNAGDTADTTVGKGCKAKGKTALSTDCSGITETGTAYVRIKKPAADQQCSTYALTVKVD